MRRPSPGRNSAETLGLVLRWLAVSSSLWSKILRVHVVCPCGMPDKGRNEACVAVALAGLDSWKRPETENTDDEVERADSERRRKKKRRKEKKKGMFGCG